MKAKTESENPVKILLAILLAFTIIGLLSCSDESDRLACQKATKEYNEIVEAVRIFKQAAPPNVCNPCTAQQAYVIEMRKLLNIQAEREVAMKKACM